MGTTTKNQFLKKYYKKTTSTKLPNLHVGYKKPPSSPPLKLPASFSQVDRQNLRGVLEIKMTALRSEHKLIQDKTFQEKMKINAELNKLKKIEDGMNFVETEVCDGSVKKFLDPGSESGQLERMTEPDIIGDVFIRTMLENFLHDLRDY